ncbi:hypothetical protein HNY73_003656 [Argiope bruennichi]|uniref:Uncharacterized protein n=1 Tax=Argiope bruennichi TaxID=94029 RepID=A0A8T0FLC0_ARGBR|nr:hypothetical protein HNY73_003656 [Argiope bruennichi]
MWGKWQFMSLQKVVPIHNFGLEKSKSNKIRFRCLPEPCSLLVTTNAMKENILIPDFFCHILLLFNL